MTSIDSRTDVAGVGDDMVFTFEVLEGELPQGPIGTSSLFIDDFTYSGSFNSGGTNTGDFNSGGTNTGFGNSE